jgi:hypothetical protein
VARVARAAAVKSAGRAALEALAADWALVAAALRVAEAPAAAAVALAGRAAEGERAVAAMRVAEEALAGGGRCHRRRCHSPSLRLQHPVEKAAPWVEAVARDGSIRAWLAAAAQAESAEALLATEASEGVRVVAV